MFLVSNSCGGGKKEGAGNHSRDERETEEKKRMFRKAGAVACSNCVGIGAGAELLILENCHTGYKLRAAIQLVTVVDEERGGGVPGVKVVRQLIVKLAQHSLKDGNAHN